MTSADSKSLLDSTQNLIEIPSVSRHETRLADHLEKMLSEIFHLKTERVGNNIIARTELGKDQRLLLGGHIDTVIHPPDFVVTRFPESISGPGAVDMKGGLAIMLELARIEPKLDVSFVFYVCEEVDISESGLRQIESERPDLLEASAAILMEPTGAAIEAGCQGSMKVLLNLKGKRAHTARAWKGSNAIHRLAPVFLAINEYVPRQPVIEGCQFHEAIQVVSITGGVAGNVVPDQAQALINVRFAPDRDSNAALSELKELIEKALGSSVKILEEAPAIKEAGNKEAGKKSKKARTPGDSLTVLDRAEPAAPSLDHPVFAELKGQVEQIRAKLGWTDVSFFYEKNIPALNFGPGDPELAHTQDERVFGKELMEVYEKLSALLAGKSS